MGQQTKTEAVKNLSFPFPPPILLARPCRSRRWWGVKVQEELGAQESTQNMRRAPPLYDGMMRRTDSLEKDPGARKD